MPRTIRFHLDENATPRIAVGLRHRGIDVTTTAEAGLFQASDEDQLAFANTEVRVLFTQDADFLRLHAAGLEHPGIIYCASGSRSIGDIIRSLALFWELLEPEEMRGRVEYI
jgi:predicted nuclease of predicted toxin-antitoxin system